MSPVELQMLVSIIGTLIYNHNDLHIRNVCLPVRLQFFGIPVSFNPSHILMMALVVVRPCKLMRNAQIVYCLKVFFNAE